MDDIQPPKPPAGKSNQVVPEAPSEPIALKPETDEDTKPFKVGQDFDPNRSKDKEPTETTIPLPVEKKPELAKPKKSKLKKLLLIFIILVVLGGAGFGAWWFGFRDSGTPSSSSSETTVNTEEEVAELEAVNSDLVASDLSGVDVSKSDSERPVTGIMIENSGDARPQSGLKEADVIFEAIAEGGITRFLALYQAKQPDYIGPVRSARPYYVSWAKMFDASYAHAGGSPDGISKINQLGVKDINAFLYGDDVFFRINDRYAPHNLYTKFPKGLDKVNSQIGNTNSSFTPWWRKKDVAQTPTAKKIDIDISSDFYNVHYDYDKKTNTYLRSEGGEAHLDAASGDQLAPKVVLVMAMENHISGQYNVYDTTGKGTFYAFQDGVVSQGVWRRKTENNNYSFTDKYGFPFNFNKGQTWVTVVGNTEDLSYTP